MTDFIQFLNLWGERFLQFAQPMLIQSSLLIAVLFLLDLLLRRRVRAVIRYGLWMLVLVKLVLPPSFASPTGLAYWLPVKQPEPRIIVATPAQVTVTYSDAEPSFVPATVTPLPPPKPTLTWPGILLLGWASVALGLVMWLLWRARFVSRMSKQAHAAPDDLLELLQSCRQQLGIKRTIHLKLSTDASSPAVCGLWRPTILIPAPLADKLAALPMRAVLLHELSHIKRGDLWINYAQTLLQIAYWFHPLLWLANAIIRRVREQAVDEMVMVELGHQADAYPITLFEVAKLTFTRPVLSLGLVGIMESKSALKERIQTLLSRPIPTMARLGWKGLTIVSFVGLISLPMASHPTSNAAQVNDYSATYQFDPAFKNYFGQQGVDEIMKALSAKNKSTNSITQIAALGELPATEIQKSNTEATAEPIKQSGVSTSNQQAAATLVQEGRELFASGKLDESEAKLKLAQKADPTNRSADYYLNLIRVQRYARLAREREETTNKDDSTPNPDARTNFFSRTSKGRQEISAKLERIWLADVHFDSLPLGEVIKALSIEVKKRDPEKRGINFMINPHGYAQPAKSLSDTAGEPLDIDSVLIKIHPAITDVRLVDVLDAIVKVADKPIKYSIEDYAVVFSAKTAEVTPLYTRFFKVDTNAFYQNFSSVGTNSIRALFQRYGVDFEPPKNMYFSDGKGLLMVRASLEELDKVEQVLHELNLAPPVKDADTKKEAQKAPDETPPRAKNKGPVIVDLPPYGRFFRSEGRATNAANTNGEQTLKADAAANQGKQSTDTNLYTRNFKVDPKTFLAGLRKQVTLPESATPEETQQALRKYFSAVGLDLQPPKRIFLNDQTGALLVRATLPELDALEQGVQLLNDAPSQIMIETKFIEVTDKVAKEVWRSVQVTQSGGTNVWTSILTKSQMITLVRHLEFQRGVDFLEQPRVTTLSGRQTHVETTDLRTVVTGIDQQALTPPGITSTNRGYFITKTLPFGPSIDVIPTVAPDGYTISMTVIPTVTEFLGYDKPPSKVPVYINGKRENATPPLPRFRTRQIVTSALVWDGQTLMLGNPLDENSRNAEKPGDGKKRLIVLITPTIIDPAGNRVHTEEEMPFAKEKVPPQEKR